MEEEQNGQDQRWDGTAQKANLILGCVVCKILEVLVPFYSALVGP